MRLTEAELRKRICKFTEGHGGPPKKIHLTNEQRQCLLHDLSLRSNYRMAGLKDNKQERYQGIELVISDAFELSK